MGDEFVWAWTYGAYGLMFFAISLSLIMALL